MTDDTTISTDRLLLRLVTPDDAPDIFDYCKDPAVARFTSWPAHRSLDDARQYVAFVMAHDSKQTGSLRHVWAIRLRQHTTVVGTIDLIQREDDTAYTDFALAQPLWNQGCMTEAVRALTDWGFARLPDLRQIRSTCLTENAGSGRVLEKAGFILVRRESVRLNEKFGFESRDVSRYEKARPRPAAS